ncbi:amidohydrolase [Denitratisoma oestradiolicum]|uniref:Amidohydrolase n=1 Tax=Denitratisoma oestradiolicum TaxID=311182 RepID=A0A6S6XWJ3_9PROT|nr:amidohydrolase [Denitratisoma oestradiolicum]TWO79296.1 amidohydrolase [Denitratisoma oestradiolicum]CAB1370379.1 Amidohydrolase [Denitratisoma oestradiolicum]
MKRKLAIVAMTLVLLVIAVAALLFWQTILPQPPQRQLFLNGVVLTMDPADRVVSALAVEGERIVAVGDSDDLKARYGKDAVIHDLAGKALLPGFVDAHGHFPASGLAVIGVDLNSPPIGTLETMAQLQARMGAKAAETAKGKWVFGFGYDDTLLAERRHPTRQDLDAISTEHPIYVWHISGHMGVANSRALALAGIGPGSPNPPGGVIVRDARGEATGLVQENSAIEMQKLAMQIGPLDFVRMVRQAAAEYAAQGITTAQNGATDRRSAQGLAWASRFGLIPMRLELWPMWNSLGPELRDGKLKAVDYDTDRLHLGAVKFFSDGSIQGYTGFLGHPYHVPYHGDAEYRGFPTMDQKQLVEEIGRYHRAGIQLAIHSNGDAAIDNVLDAIETAQQETTRPDIRHILVHAQTARLDQLDRMARLSVIPSFFSAHTYYWGDRHRDIFLGPERAANISPTRWAKQKGLRFSVHLDTPVAPMNPRLLLWSTVNRLSSSGQPIGPEQRLTVMEALRAMTIDAAWQIHQENRIGSLEPGKLADMVVLSDDPRKRPEALRNLKVDATLVGGVTIFPREL